MKRYSILILLFWVVLLIFSFPAINTAGPLQPGASYYTTKLSDDQVVYLTPGNFDITPNQKGDDTQALQAAIDLVEEKYHFGVVLVPEGEYEISNTIHVWKGIRLIGYGKNRPVFVLPENSKGYNGEETKYIIHFVSNKPQDGRPVRDANPGTFYSALSNINFEIRDGNPAAVAVRSHYAQHCYIAHVDFTIGNGLAGVDKVGNEIDDCQFIGGEYGIMTTKPSPSWPFLMVDTRFTGQRKAAISTQEGGLTLVRNQFFNVPSAIIVNPERAEELFMEDCRFENITGPAVVISDEYNARPQYNFKNLVCDHVPVLAKFRSSGQEIEVEHAKYIVTDFCHGMQIDDLGKAPEVKTTYEIQPLKKMPKPVPSDVPSLPDGHTWVNLKDYGAVGDGETDDTNAIQKAIAENRTLFVPAGRYLVSETICLAPQTVLIGLNPISTQFVLADGLPACNGAGTPVPLLQAPKGGNNIVVGIGLDTGASNDRAVAAKWMAGSNSLMSDVRFIGGHGTYAVDGSYVPVYNESRTGEPDPRRNPWDAQYTSLWITDGGGGTFKDIWTPNTWAQSGVYVSDTDTPGRLYGISVEHHVRNEVIFKNVSNWKIYDLQMEEESAESPDALPVRIENCHNLTFANLYLYRVIRMTTPFPYAVLLNQSTNIQFCGMHVYSPTKFSFDNTLYDWGHDVEVRERELARLNVSGNTPEKNRDARVEKVVDGFEFIDGSAVDAKGNVYFIDSRRQCIYRWAPAEARLTLISNAPIHPVAIAVDRSGHLLVTTADASVVSLDPENPDESLTQLSPVHPNEHQAAVYMHPGHLWRDEHDFLDITTSTPEHPPVTFSSYQAYFRKQVNPHEAHVVSPDGSTAIPEFNDLRRAYSLRPAVPGQSFYMADEFGQKTWRFTVKQDGILADPRLFAQRGELDVAVDAKGNVYIPAGQVYVYNPSGELIDVIHVPERPATLVFGGPDHKTLYITARSSLYRVRLDNPGR